MLVRGHKRAGTIYGQTAYNSREADSGELRTKRGEVETMCFRPSPVSHNDCNDGNTICCETCGMRVDVGLSNCPYCGDPIPADPPDEFSRVDPSHSTRII